ncbi:MAG: hypothetical protein IPF96_21320, partial [Rhodobacter sp.]|nr:hypothetical protein [Rhodobacter sp.]
AMQLLSGLGQLAAAVRPLDTDILYQFIQSQELVGKIDDAIDLRAIWSRADPAVDPLYAFHVPGTIEDLMRYWPRMVKVYNTEGAGILNVTVQPLPPRTPARSPRRSMKTAPRGSTRCRSSPAMTPPAMLRETATRRSTGSSRRARP